MAKGWTVCVAAMCAALACHTARVVRLATFFVALTASGPQLASATETFTLKDYVCAVAPSECRGPLTDRLYFGPPEAEYTVEFAGKTLVLPMGHVDPIQLSVLPRGKQLFLQGLGAEIALRTPHNLKEFLRPPMRDLVRIVAYAAPSPPGPAAVKARSDEFEQRRKALVAPLRMPDRFELEHWSNDYLRQPFYKPCESKDEGNGCGRASQDDVYKPLRPATTTLITCASHLYVDHGIAEMAMSEAERDAYYLSDAYLKPDWRQRVNPHCIQRFFHAPLNSDVQIVYRLGLLSQWQRMESRTIQLLEAALRRKPAGTAPGPSR